MTNRSSLTISSLVGETGRLLDNGGYLEIDSPEEGIWSSGQARLFEDAYSIVGVVIYETWEALNQEWESAQTELVSLISKHFSKGEPKAWDGYLVLLTPSPVSNSSEIAKIRYDTTRVRKIVATGEELVHISDLGSVLSPLMPLQPKKFESDDKGVFAKLPEILEKQGVSEEITFSLVEAYLKQESLMENLEGHREENENH